MSKYVYSKIITKLFWKLIRVNHCTFAKRKQVRLDMMRACFRILKKYIYAFLEESLSGQQAQQAS